MAYEVHAKCFAESTEALSETFPKKMLTEKSEISGSYELENAGNITVRALYELRARKRMREGKMTAVLCLRE